MTDDRLAFDRITRRMALKGILLGGAGLALTGRVPSFARAGDPPATGAAPPRAKAVIQIWMWGGPCHIDTFDPKEAGYDYCGPLGKPIATNVDGIRLSPLLPLLARHADKFSLIRSMTHGVDGHETASYIVQTGHAPGQDRLVYPSIGSAVSAFKGYDRGYKKTISPYVVLTEPLGRFNEVGFLGQRFKPFCTGGDPSQKRFAVEGIVTEGISDERQRERRQLLHDLDTLGKALPGDPELKRLDVFEEKAYELILGDAGKVFDLSGEKDDLRERYGKNRFGQSCLVARRLVEYGVPFVAINYGGWDTHKQHFEIMNRKLPELDRGLSALLQDLADRGLHDSTITWLGGEFGRTPKVLWEEPWNGGRGHWGRCFSALVGGGGFKGGHVVGATDAKGTEVVDRPVHPRELIASVYSLLGIDPDGPMPNAQGLDVRVLPPAPEGARGAGRLVEIT